MKKQKFETRHATGIIEVEGYPKTYEGIEYFIYKLGTWLSVEKSTGLGIACGSTIKDCEKETESKIDGAKDYILNTILRFKEQNKQINNKLGAQKMKNNTIKRASTRLKIKMLIDTNGHDKGATIEIIKNDLGIWVGDGYLFPVATLRNGAFCEILAQE